MAVRCASRSRSPVPEVPTVRAPEQAQDFVRALPAAELLELCWWRVTRQCVCEDSNCYCATLSCFKAGRFVKLGDRPPECHVKAARVELKRRSLCHCCGGKLVPIGDARANGTWRHNDWPSRRYHKKCYIAALRGDFDEKCGLPETDVE